MRGQQADALRDAIAGYAIVVGYGECWRPAEDAYYAWCERNERPYIRIRRRRTYAEIALDTLPANILLTESGVLSIRHQLRDATVPRGHYAWGKDYCTGGRIRVVGSLDLAARLYATATAGDNFARLR